jgi:2-keto-4-pentenoate hydratase/2-oxohepta-3-ene-1,7-dioic acid hydratase in catechol pathway
MRLVTFQTGATSRAGIELDDCVVDAEGAAVRAGLSTPGDGRSWTTRTLLAAGGDALARLEEAATALRSDPLPETTYPLADVPLGPPIPDPDKIVCIGLNYRDRNSLTGPAGEIVLPIDVDAVDYEAELAVVIGRRAKNVAETDALAYVAGAMAFNDVSARELQMQTSQFTAGKAIDTFAPCGPALVTLDELGDLQSLRLQTRVNGDVVQDGTTADMIFSVTATIAFLSRLMTLEPGDIIATGTPAGVGFTREPPLLLGAGDVVEVEAERIGTLRNRVAASAARAASARDT